MNLPQVAGLRLDFNHKLVGQGYDGASVMSGENSGVATLIKNRTPLVSSIHCHVQVSNLAWVNCWTTVPQAAEFFVFLENSYVFVSGSYVHA